MLNAIKTYVVVVMMLAAPMANAQIHKIDPCDYAGSPHLCRQQRSGVYAEDQRGLRNEERNACRYERYYRGQDPDGC